MLARKNGNENPIWSWNDSPAVASDSTYGGNCFMYKALNNTKAIWGYTEDLEIHTGPPALNYEDNTRCIYAIKVKRVTPIVKHIYIHMCFLHEQYDKSIFIPKYEKYIIMSADMCTKPCLGPVISCSTKWMTGFHFCINISGHALMGRPAARLETMALVIRSFVLV